MESARRLLGLWHQALQTLGTLFDLGIQQVPKTAKLRISRAAWKSLWIKGELTGTVVVLSSEVT